MSKNLLYFELIKKFWEWVEKKLEKLEREGGYKQKLCCDAIRKYAKIELLGIDDRFDRLVFWLGPLQAYRLYVAIQGTWLIMLLVLYSSDRMDLVNRLAKDIMQMVRDEVIEFCKIIEQQVKEAEENEEVKE